MCGSADCDQDTFYLKLGDNAYTELKIEFVIADTSTVDYVKPYTDKVSTFLRFFPHFCLFECFLQIDFQTYFFNPLVDFPGYVI